MHKINIAHVPEAERRSPSGKFHSFRQDLSVALGRKPDSLDLSERHPFDLMRGRLPPGASFCPYHAESAQWELYLVLAGRGVVRHPGGRTEVETGDLFLFKPGEAHQLLNESGEDFLYYVVADNPVGDSCYYPDSGKWSVFKEGGPPVIVQGTETDYFEGED